MTHTSVYKDRNSEKQNERKIKKKRRKISKMNYINIFLLLGKRERVGKKFLVEKLKHYPQVVDK